MKRCARCKKFLGGHKRFCGKCIRIINAEKRIRAMQVTIPRRESKIEIPHNEIIIHHDSGMMPSRHAKTDEQRLAESGYGVQIENRFYRGKSNECQLCYTVADLSICQRLHGKTILDEVKACDNCKNGFLKRLGYIQAFEVVA